MLEQCEKHYGMKTFNDFHILKQEGPFDIIISEDVIEHCIEPQETLSNILHILAENGVFYSNTPTASGISGKILGQSWWCAGPDDHIQMFRLKSLMSLFEKTGFKIIQSDTQSMIPWLEEKPKNTFDHIIQVLYYFLNKNEPKLRELNIGDYCVILGTK